MNLLKMFDYGIYGDLDGPSRTVRIEPIETPMPAPREEPFEPEETPVPERPLEEPVPA